MWNLFKVNNKDIRATSMASLSLTLNIFLILLWCFHCLLWPTKWAGSISSYRLIKSYCIIMYVLLSTPEKCSKENICYGLYQSEGKWTLPLKFLFVWDIQYSFPCAAVHYSVYFKDFTSFFIPRFWNLRRRIQNPTKHLRWNFLRI